MKPNVYAPRRKSAEVFQSQKFPCATRLTQRLEPWPDAPPLTLTVYVHYPPRAGPVRAIRKSSPPIQPGAGRQQCAGLDVRPISSGGNPNLCPVPQPPTPPKVWLWMRQKLDSTTRFPVGEALESVGIF